MGSAAAEERSSREERESNQKQVVNVRTARAVKNARPRGVRRGSGSKCCTVQYNRRNAATLAKEVRRDTQKVPAGRKSSRLRKRAEGGHGRYAQLDRNPDR